MVIEKEVGDGNNHKVVAGNDYVGILIFGFWNSWLCYACLSFVNHVDTPWVAIIEYATEVHPDIAEKLNFAKKKLVFICEFTRPCLLVCFSNLYTVYSISSIRMHVFQIFRVDNLVVNYYQKFLPKLTRLVQQLTVLLQKNRKWVWFQDCERARTKAKVLPISWYTTIQLLPWNSSQVPHYRA